MYFVEVFLTFCYEVNKSGVYVLKEAITNPRILKIILP